HAGSSGDVCCQPTGAGRPVPVVPPSGLPHRMRPRGAGVPAPDLLPPLRHPGMLRLAAGSADRLQPMVGQVRRVLSPEPGGGGGMSRGFSPLERRCLLALVSLIRDRESDPDKWEYTEVPLRVL